MWQATYLWGRGVACLRRRTEKQGENEWAQTKNRNYSRRASLAAPAKIKNVSVLDPQGSVFSYRSGTLPDFFEALLQLPHAPAPVQTGNALGAFAQCAGVIPTAVIGDHGAAVFAIHRVIHFAELEHAGQPLR